MDAVYAGCSSNLRGPRKHSRWCWTYYNCGRYCIFASVPFIEFWSRTTFHNSRSTKGVRTILTTPLLPLHTSLSTHTTNMDPISPTYPFHPLSIHAPTLPDPLPNPANKTAAASKNPGASATNSSSCSPANSSFLEVKAQAQASSPSIPTTQTLPPPPPPYQPSQHPLPPAHPIRETSIPGDQARVLLQQTQQGARQLDEQEKGSIVRRREEMADAKDVAKGDEGMFAPPICAMRCDAHGGAHCVMRVAGSTHASGIEDGLVMAFSFIALVYGKRTKANDRALLQSPTSGAAANPAAQSRTSRRTAR